MERAAGEDARLPAEEFRLPGKCSNLISLKPCVFSWFYVVTFKTSIHWQDAFYSIIINFKLKGNSLNNIQIVNELDLAGIL